MSEEFKASDDLLEDLFGPPAVAAADLHELRVWCHGRTALTPTEASSRAREIIRGIDPTWPARSLTNEKVTMPYGTRPRGFGMKIRLAESTIECLEAVAHGDDPVTTKWRSPHDYETLWPAQSQSWGTWVSQCQDRRGGIGGPEMRQHAGQLTLPYVHPAALMAGVRRGGTPYLDAVADVMVMAEDPAVRANRLALLGQLHTLMNQVADISRLAQ